MFLGQSMRRHFLNVAHTMSKKCALMALTIAGSSEVQAVSNTTVLKSYIIELYPALGLTP